ncbi:hypothetical protein pb186bvf_017083 [Paramecium bursaria]
MDILLEKKFSFQVYLGYLYSLEIMKNNTSLTDCLQNFWSVVFVEKLFMFQNVIYSLLGLSQSQQYVGMSARKQQTQLFIEEKIIFFIDINISNKIFSFFYKFIILKFVCSFRNKLYRFFKIQSYQELLVAQYQFKIFKVYCQTEQLILQKIHINNILIHQIPCMYSLSFKSNPLYKLQQDLSSDSQIMNHICIKIVFINSIQ